MRRHRYPLTILAALAAAVLVVGGAAMSATVNGTEGNDTLQGTSGDDTMNGLGGADWLNASGGADVAYGGTGNDTVGGGTGADKLYGQDSNDTLSDGTSADPAVDELYGGVGDDKLTAYAGNDALRGEAGVDILRGGIGNDSLDGGLGADNLSGQDGDDTVADGPADDADPDTIDGGPGNDTITAGGGDDVATGQSGNDRIEGGPGNDTLYGPDKDQNDLSGDDVVAGGSGNDKVFGGAGVDRLHGDDGNDALSDGPETDASADQVDGGPGDDLVYAASGQTVVDTVSCGEGRDEVWVDAADTVASDCEVVHDDPAFAYVTFSNPVEIDTALQLGDRHDADTAMLESDYTAGVPVHDGFTLPAQMAAEAAEQAYEEARLGYFEDTVRDIEELQAGMSVEESEELDPQLEAMRAALANNDAGNITVTKSTVYGEQADLDDLAADGSTMTTESGEMVVESVDVIDTKELAEHSEELGREEAQIESMGDQPSEPVDAVDEVSDADGTMSTEANTWWPNQGSSHVRRSWREQYRNTHRYSDQFFRWDSTSFLYNTDSYEHDLLINYTDKRSYLNGSMTTSCFPKGAYWSTTYPDSARPYLDTNWGPLKGCNQDYLVYTIGAALAGELRAGRTYQTFIRMPNGLPDHDGALLIAQKGYRRGCYLGVHPAFCVFGDARRRLIDPAGEGTRVDTFRVPATTRWAERGWGQ